MAKNKVVCNGITFNEEKIKSGAIYLSNSIAFDELGIDTLDAELDLSSDIGGTFFAPADADRLHTSEDEVFIVRPYIRVLITDPAQFVYGKRVEFYRDDKIFQIFYMSTIRRVSKYFYAISCVSAVGLLDNVMHYGGLYTGQTFSAVASEIIRNTITYTVASNVANLRVYGWLPVASARDNLKQLLFASGVALKKNNSGNVSFELLDTSIPSQIPDDRIMLDGSVDFPSAANEAVIVEHAFFSTTLDETVTLYDGDAVASTFVSPNGVTRTGILVTFDDPAYGLVATGVSILESGVNYAVLSGGGHATLTGKKYTHTTREVIKSISSSASSMVGEKNVARVENATLVTALNSEVIADRIASYYSSTRTLSEKILVEAERPGDYVRLNNPFEENDEGIISSMDITISNTLLSGTKIVAGYKPVSGGGFTNVLLLTGSGTFSVPAGITKIRIVLIGGGRGGYSGTMGRTAKAGTTIDKGPADYGGWNHRSRIITTGTGGEGGAAGNGGDSGDIFQATLDVTPGQVFSYSCGTGGAGGVSIKVRTTENFTSVIGAKGGNTTFGAYSSASGSPSSYGYIDIISGNTYAGNGSAGIAGGNGGGYNGNEDEWFNTQQRGPNVVYNGVTYTAGANHNEAVTQASSYSSDSGLFDVNAGGFYGAGGGAAAGANGLLSNTTPSATAGARTSYATAVGEAGGQGADAVAPAKSAVYGKGGTGGNGGGGMGGPGLAAVETTLTNVASGTDPGLPRSLSLSQNIGTGRGLGSNGGQGGDGCILVYY